MMKKYMSYAWIYMFAVMFMTAFLTYPLFAKFMDYSNIENREKADFPILSSENYIEYHHAFEDWFNDILPYQDVSYRVTVNLYFMDLRSQHLRQSLWGKKAGCFIMKQCLIIKKLTCIRQSNWKQSV